MVAIMGLFLVSSPARSMSKLTGSSDFYENVNRYQSSAAHAVVSPKVHETEAGQITTALVVSSNSSAVWVTS